MRRGEAGGRRGGDSAVDDSCTVRVTGILVRDCRRQNHEQVNWRIEGVRAAQILHTLEQDAIEEGSGRGNGRRPGRWRLRRSSGG